MTITEPGSNNAPTAVIASGTCPTFTTCVMSGTGSSDPDTATVTGSRTTSWSWGDGTPDTTGTTASQSHVYNVAGSYTVTLRVARQVGQDSGSGHLGVDHPDGAGRQQPARPSRSPATCTARTCSVSSTGTADTDGGIRSYTWNWGDGTPDTATHGDRNRAAHVYAAAGTYTITLTVTDNWGRATTVTRNVTVT